MLVGYTINLLPAQSFD